MDRNDIREEGFEQKGKGMLQGLKGKVQQVAGAITGNDSQRAKGVGNELGGNIRETIGDATEKVTRP